MTPLFILANLAKKISIFANDEKVIIRSLIPTVSRVPGNLVYVPLWKQYAFDDYWLFIPQTTISSLSLLLLLTVTTPSKDCPVTQMALPKSIDRYMLHDDFTEDFGSKSYLTSCCSSLCGFPFWYNRNEQVCLVHYSFFFQHLNKEMS